MVAPASDDRTVRHLLEQRLLSRRVLSLRPLVIATLSDLRPEATTFERRLSRRGPPTENAASFLWYLKGRGSDKAVTDLLAIEVIGRQRASVWAHDGARVRSPSIFPFIENARRAASTAGFATQLDVTTDFEIDHRFAAARFWILL